MCRWQRLVVVLCAPVLITSLAFTANPCADAAGRMTATWPPNCPGDLFPDSGSSYGLNWLGSFEHAPGAPDHLMSASIFDTDRLIVASAHRMIVVGRTPSNHVLPQFAQLMTDYKLPSNLDGAPTGGNYSQKFFNSAVYGSYVYVATRYDPLYAFQISGSGAGSVIRRKWMAPKSRTFTENLQVVGSNLYAVHHADGVEVLSLANPAAPASTATLKLTDSWGLAVRSDGNMLIADGAAGVQWVQYNATAKSLTRMAGETLETSAGVAFDVAFVGANTAIAAIGGQGVAVYYFNPADPDPNHRLVRTGVFTLPGTCVDVEPYGTTQAAVACRTWVHVINVDAAGVVTTTASAQMHRRLGRQPWPDTPSTNIASHVSVSGSNLYVAAWDHVDLFQLAASANIPDIRLSGQRIHFGGAAGSQNIIVANGGHAALSITGLKQSSNRHVTCALDSMNLAAGATATLTVTYDGLAAVQDNSGCSVQSNDPDDGATSGSSVAIPIYANMAKYVDPGETAPEFNGNTMLRDYTIGVTTTVPFDLANYKNPDRDKVVGFNIWGSW